MKLFISWSGERSKALAHGLREWIPLVLHYAEPWVSEADVEAGERWQQVVAGELDDSNFGIVCVTKENVNAPWVLFEAGALAKSLSGGRVIPLLLDIEFSEIGGPLAQFQAKKVDQSGLSDVIHSIDEAATEEVPTERIGQLFEALWPQFEQALSAIPEAGGPVKPTRPSSEIMEELVSGVRTLESRMRGMEEAVSTPGPSRPVHTKRTDPFIVVELARMLAEEPGDPITLLLAASLVSQEAPWLYELGLSAHTAYHGWVSDPEGVSPDKVEGVLMRFDRAWEMMMGRSGRHSGIDEQMLTIAYHELLHGPNGIQDMIDRLREPRQRRHRSPGDHPD